MNRFKLPPTPPVVALPLDVRLDDDAASAVRAHSMDLEALLDRHVRADFSDTPDNVKEESEAALAAAEFICGGSLKAPEKFTTVHIVGALTVEVTSYWTERGSCSIVRTL